MCKLHVLSNNTLDPFYLSGMNSDIDVLRFHRGFASLPKRLCYLPCIYIYT